MSNQAPVPALYEYVPEAVVAQLRGVSEAVPGSPAMRVVSAGAAPAVEAASKAMLTPDALAFVLAVYRRSLQLPAEYRLSTLLKHRKMKRREINRAGRRAVESGAPFRDVRLSDGTVVLGYRDDLKHIRDDPSWRVDKFPDAFDRFHDTITGPPTANIVANALKSGTSFFMVDFEDSSTVAFDSVVTGLHNVTLANRRELDYTSASGKRYTLLPNDDDGNLAQMLIRFEGLHLPNAHVLVDGHPMPAHIVTIGLFLFHNYLALRKNQRVPAFYIPKIESYEEAQYLAAVFEAAETELAMRVGASNYAPYSVRAFVIVENVFSVYQKEEILYALRHFIVGLNCGWHDYMASIGAVHQSIPSFNMPPKSNLRIVIEHLEAYQMGITEVCRRRGAIPIGGMNAMVPPQPRRGVQIDRNIFDKIKAAFSADFWVQVGRGLQGVWLAHTKLAPVVQQLIKEHKAKLGGRSYADVAPRIDLNQITHDKMLVTSLPDGRPIVAEFEHNIRDALQYLASYVLGTGCVGLTARMSDGSQVRLMEDAATLERSRREIWSYVRYGKKLYRPDGSFVRADEALFRISAQRVMNHIAAGDADVPFTAHTKNAYDIAKGIVHELCLSPDPVDYFTVLTTKHLLAPFRANPRALLKFEKAAEFPFLRAKNLALESSVVFVTNESFAPARTLLKNYFPVFRPKTFGAAGQVYDGWETARHNFKAPDYVILRLARPARVAGFVVDTAHFDGNHANGASIYGLVQSRVDHQRVEQHWVQLVVYQPLQGNTAHFFRADPKYADSIVTEIKLCNHPDGGIARFEIYGEYASLGKVTNELLLNAAAKWIQTLPDKRGLPEGYKPDPVVEVTAEGDEADEEAKMQGGHRHSLVERQQSYIATLHTRFPRTRGLSELAAAILGGRVIASSSSHYSLPGNMLKAHRAINMGDGWETRRARVDSLSSSLVGPVPTFNWTIVRLGSPGRIERFVLDTQHFKNNPPIAFAIEGTYASDRDLNEDNFCDAQAMAKYQWASIIKPTSLLPHREHEFEVPKSSPQRKQVFTHVLLKIFPCGGMARFRVFGHPTSNKYQSKI